VAVYRPESSAGSGFTTWDISDATNLTNLHSEVYELEAPGPNPDRQEAPHPHQVIMDPTGSFLLTPDLGADVVRIHAVDPSGTLAVTAVEPLAVPPGSGPRHAAFAVQGDKTYLYVVNELANTILGYAVTYGKDPVSLGFEQVYESGTHGEGGTVPPTAGAAEIVVSVSVKS
jgi:6-phosphogluconolactonase (cycloisomerase 2 family)